MKKNYLIIASILCIQICAIAQKSAKDWFMEAQHFWDKEQFDKALAGYQYIVDSFPNSDQYYCSFFNTAVIYRNDNDFSKAIPIFTKIFTENLGRQDKRVSLDTKNSSKGVAKAYWGSRAGYELYRIYSEMENYDSALYFYRSDGLETMSFCGNANAGYAMFDALKYAGICEKAKKPGKAFARLLPFTFGTIAFEGNNSVFDFLLKMLKTVPNAKSCLNRALDDMSYKSGTYYFTFLNEEIAMPWNLIGTNPEEKDKQKIIDAFKRTSVYKLVQELE